MKTKISVKILAASIVMMLLVLQVSAQNKDVDKGKETLTKALEQKDASKKQDMISKARELFQKGGLKPQEISLIMGDAYLDKGDLQDAATAYGSASKTDKKDGFKKVADAYVDVAFSGEEKTLTKALNKAMDFYKKADALKEGARTIGDRFYEKGADSYDKALEYYITGDAQVKIEQIAKDYFDKGGDNENKAAEVYLKLKTPEGYKKAGDIYYDKKEYQKAIEAYQAGGNTEGIKKYADYLYGQMRNEEADNLYVKLAEILANQKDDAAASDQLEKLGHESMEKGSYALAARIYDKAGNANMSDKCKGYAKLIAFDIDSARMYFTNINDAEMIKAITDNTKQLITLKDLGDNFDEIIKGAPPVNMITDSVTGLSAPSASDQKLLEDYYKSSRDQIIKDVYEVSANMSKLINPELKKFARIRFMQYGAIRNILNTETFAAKKQKSEIKAKDVVL